MKQKYIDAHMKVAETYANLSTAVKLKVGAIVVKEVVELILITITP